MYLQRTWLDPPLLHEDTAIAPSPAVAVKEEGAVGLLNGVIEFDAADESEVKVEFFADTVKVLAVFVERLLKEREFSSEVKS